MELPEITRLSNDVDVDVDVEKRPFDATTASTTAFRPSTSLGMWNTPNVTKRPGAGTGLQIANRAEGL
jgi:hypothetical protein